MRTTLSLKHTLTGIVGVLALICIGQGALSIHKLGSVRHSVSEVARNWLPSVVAVNNLRAAAADVRVKQLRTLATAGSREEHAENLGQLAKAFALVADAGRIYQTLISSDAERDLYTAFARLWDRYSSVGDRAIRMSEAGQANDAIALLGNPENIALYNDMRDALTKTVALNEAGAQRDATLAQSETQAAMTAAWVAIVLALAAAAGAAAFGLLRVSRPIQAMTGAMTRLAAGDAVSEVPYRERRDEIGAMAGAVQVFKENLLRARALEAETAQARLAAEEQRRAGMRDMADRFEAAVGGILAGVTGAATELQATAGAMSGTAAQTAAQSGAVAASAEEAAGNVTTVAAAAEELGASVDEIGRQVDGSAELARLAVSEAGQTGALVQDLSQAVARIGDVVGLISTIAAQTNLLALNATIEAARAGDAGRGFAVVASEVKALAGQTARATEEIATQIARVQGSTGEAVGAITGIAGRIQEISGVATSIAAAVEEQGAATREIVRNVSQASVGTGAVTANIAGVAGAAEETGAAASQVLASASELSRQSEHLSAEVGRFLETVRAA